MRFDIVQTLEIPQGATELTTSQLEQISGGNGYGDNNCKSGKHSRNNNHGKHFKKSGYGNYGKYGKYRHEESYGDDCGY